jgi:hypothetical protein
MARCPPSGNISIGAARHCGSLEGQKRPTTLPSRSTRNLGSIPLDSANARESEDSRLVFVGEAVEGMSLGAVDVDFGEDGESDGKIFFAEGADLGRRIRFLRAELA